MVLSLLFGVALGWWMFSTDPIPCQTIVDVVADTADANQAAVADISKRLDACVARERQAVASNNAALREALLARTTIERDLAAWQQRFSRVSSDCTQALINMEFACAADIESY